jgi:hypothetical protein
MSSDNVFRSSGQAPGLSTREAGGCTILCRRRVAHTARCIAQSFAGVNHIGGPNGTGLIAEKPSNRVNRKADHRGATPLN